MDGIILRAVVKIHLRHNSLDIEARVCKQRCLYIRRKCEHGQLALEHLDDAIDAAVNTCAQQTAVTSVKPMRRRTGIVTLLTFG